jgi:DNA-binding transcriptional regulator YiaG
VVIFPLLGGSGHLAVIEGDELARLTGKELEPCINAGFIAHAMGALTHQTKQAKNMPVATLFRLKHRGAVDCADLLKTYRAQFHVTQAQLVRLTGFSPRSVAKWSQGETPSPKQEKALVEMDRLFDGLARMIEHAQVGRWLSQPNPAFDGSTPLQVVERGEIDRIWRMLYDLESGQPC